LHDKAQGSKKVGQMTVCDIPRSQHLLTFQSFCWRGEGYSRTWLCVVYLF
jgi:hypothetical protein